MMLLDQDSHHGGNSFSQSSPTAVPLSSCPVWGQSCGQPWIVPRARGGCRGLEGARGAGSRRGIARERTQHRERLGMIFQGCGEGGK